MCGIDTSLNPLSVAQHRIDGYFRNLGSARDCESVIDAVDRDNYINDAAVELMRDDNKACSGQRFPYLAYQFVDAHSNSLLAAN